MDFIYCTDKCNPPRHHDRNYHAHGVVTAEQAIHDIRTANHLPAERGNDTHRSLPRSRPRGVVMRPADPSGGSSPR